jgi:hypothetical protein
MKDEEVVKLLYGDQSHVTLLRNASKVGAWACVRAYICLYMCVYVRGDRFAEALSF